MKTSELIGPALDWAVAKCEGGTTNPLAFTGENRSRISESWATCGPIIEREGIRMHRSYTGAWWAGSEAEPRRPIEGPTPLIAAMRCFVASRLGDEVDVPDELL